MKKYIFAIIFTLFSSAVYAEQFKVVITPFQKSADVPQETADNTRIVLEKGLVSIPKFIVLDRSNFSSILKEQELSLLNGSDSDKIAVAKLMSADKIVTGSITVYTKEKYYTVIKVIDVSSGQVELSEAIRFSGIDDFEEKSEKVINKINNKYKRKPQKPISSPDAGDINFAFTESLLFLSFGGIDLIYDTSNMSNPLKDYKIGWHVLEFQYGIRLGIIGTAVYKDYGDESTFLPIVIRVPFIIYPSETMVSGSKRQVTPGGLFLEANAAWLDTEKYDPFAELKLKYENGAWFSIWGSVMQKDDFSKDNRSYLIGVSFYLGKYEMDL